MRSIRSAACRIRSGSRMPLAASSASFCSSAMTSGVKTDPVSGLFIVLMGTSACILPGRGVGRYLGLVRQEGALDPVDHPAVYLAPLGIEHQMHQHGLGTVEDALLDGLTFDLVGRTNRQPFIGRYQLLREAVTGHAYRHISRRTDGRVRRSQRA